MLSKLFNWFQPGPKSRFTQPDLEKGETLDFNFSGTKVRFNVETGSGPEVLQRELNLYNTEYYTAYESARSLIPSEIDISVRPVCITEASFAQNERNGRGLGGVRLVVQVYYNPQASNLFRGF